MNAIIVRPSAGVSDAEALRAATLYVEDGEPYIMPRQVGPLTVAPRMNKTGCTLFVKRTSRWARVAPARTAPGRDADL